MHREVMGFSRGDGRIVDHINGNKLDNRRRANVYLGLYDDESEAAQVAREYRAVHAPFSVERKGLR